MNPSILFADVVTGKLNVREAVVWLPDDQDLDFAEDIQTELEDDEMTLDAIIE